MRRPTIYLQILVLAACVAVLTSQLVVYAQEPQEEDIRLPNGKSQKDEILKSEHKQNLEDAGRLLELAGSLKAQLEKSGYRVVSAKSIQATEEIERLAKRIRGRLRR